MFRQVVAHLGRKSVKVSAVNAATATTCTRLSSTWTHSTRPRTNHLATHSHNHPLTHKRSQSSSSEASVQLPKQELMLAFTCNKCSTRSSHTISKQAYTQGTVLVQCPGCHNRHLIADHLKIFKDNRFTIEELMEVSKSTEDLVFDEIPDKLKKVLGYYAKDAPKEYTDSDLADLEPKKLK